MSRVNPGGLPGISAKVTTAEVQIWWGHQDLQIKAPMDVIGSAAVDAGNTPTTTLRGGLLMGIKTSDGLWYPYGNTNTDGTDFPQGVLLAATPMLNPSSSAAENKVAVSGILIGGLLKAGQLLNLDGRAREAMSRRFVFDDEIPGRGWGSNWRRQVTKTANYVLLASDNFGLFDNIGAGGAVQFTLPAIGKGLRFKFYVYADQSVTVASAEGANMVVFNNAAASSIAFSTAGNKIGAVAEVYSDEAGTKWLVDLPCKHTLTVA